MKKMIKLKIGLFIIFGMAIGIIVSKVNIFKAQGSVPGNPSFGDARFYQCVLAATNHSSSGIEYNVPNSELEALTNFECGGFSVTDGINTLKNLVTLHLTGGSIGEIQTQNFSKLQTIYIDKSAKLTVVGHDNHILHELTITNGSLDTFDASEFKALGNLNLANNNLTNVKINNDQINEVVLDNNNLLSLDINPSLRTNRVSFKNQTRDIKLTKKDGKYELNLTEKDSNLDPQKVHFSNTSGTTYDAASGKFTMTRRIDTLTYTYNTGHAKAGLMPVTINLTYSPEVGTFFLGSNLQVKYTQTKTVDVTLTWPDDNIKYYCLNEENSSSSCSWQDASGNNIKTTHSFNDESDGVKTLYAFVKNDKEEISNGAKAEITLDATAPKIDKFYIGGSENPEQINSQRTTVYLTWNDEDVSSYCLSTTESSNNCTWQSATGKELNRSYTLASGKGQKTLYAYLKDKAGNISEVKFDNVNLEMEEELAAPVIDSFYIGPLYSKYTNTRTPEIHIIWSSENVTHYCVSKTNNSHDCNWQSTNRQDAIFNGTFTDGDGVKTLYAFIRSDDLISESKMATIILDTTKPVVTSLTTNGKAISNTKTEFKLSWDDNDVVSYCLSESSTYANCSWQNISNQKNTMAYYTFTTTGTKTIYAYLKDASGLVSEGKSLEVVVKSSSSTVTPNPEPDNNTNTNTSTNNNNNSNTNTNNSNPSSGGNNSGNNYDTPLDHGPQTGFAEVGVLILALAIGIGAYFKINQKKKMFRL